MISWQSRFFNSGAHLARRVTAAPSRTFFFLSANIRVHLRFSGVFFGGRDEPLVGFDFVADEFRQASSENLKLVAASLCRLLRVSGHGRTSEMPLYAASCFIRCGLAEKNLFAPQSFRYKQRRE